MQPVTNAEPWPLMQRFDYLVRTRILTGTEKVALPAPPAGYSSPYQRTALAALRALTGRDAAPTAEAWRRLLDLPERGRRDGITRNGNRFRNGYRCSVRHRAFCCAGRQVTV